MFNFIFDKQSWQKLEATMVGLSKETFESTVNAMHGVAIEMIDLAKDRVPLEYGELQASGFVTDPEKLSMNKVQVELGFSGQWAVKQHEDLTLNHPGLQSTNKAGGAQGRPKYLESAVNELEGKLRQEIQESRTTKKQRRSHSHKKGR